MDNSYTTPVIEYKKIQVNNKDIALSGSAKVSFTAPYNKINIIIHPLTEISYYEVRVTEVSEDYDIGVGECAYWTTAVPLNTDTSFIININNKIFNKGDGTYRISLYAKSAIDGSWDVSYILFTIDGEQFVPSDADTFEVLTTKDVPTHEE